MGYEFILEILNEDFKELSILSSNHICIEYDLYKNNELHLKIIKIIENNSSIRFDIYYKNIKINVTGYCNNKSNRFLRIFINSKDFRLIIKDFKNSNLIKELINQINISKNDLSEKEKHLNIEKEGLDNFIENLNLPLEFA